MTGRSVFGIDLGTTYSAIAHLDAYGQPVVLLDDSNQQLLASALFFHPSGSVLVGEQAKLTAPTDPGRFVDMIKPAMGQSGSYWSIDSKTQRPVEASALILKRLRQIAEARTGHPVEDVVITVPAYFNERQRNATQQAGQVAGLNVKWLIPEPTAAAIHYATITNANQRILVFDLGGGTFDVTVIQTDEKSIRVVCVKGDPELGGRKWDRRLVEIFANEWRTSTTICASPETDAAQVHEWLVLAEESKRLLTTRESTPVRITYQGQTVRFDLTRAQFDDQTRDLLDCAALLTEDVVSEARQLGVEHIDVLLLVGGSSRMPQVRERLQQLLPGTEIKLHEPDLAVVKGAAIFAADAVIREQHAQIADRYFADRPSSKPGSEKSPWSDMPFLLDGLQHDLERERPLSREIINVCSRSFGLEGRNPVTDQLELTFLIKRNSPVPATVTRQFETAHPNQAEARITVYESTTETLEERDFPRTANDPTVQRLKSILLRLPPGLPRRHPVEVTYRLSADGGRLLVTARDPKSTARIEEEVLVEGALTTLEIETAARRVDEIILT